MGEHTQVAPSEIDRLLADLSLAEFRQIAAVVEGRSELGLLRRSLWANWGFCARHTWWLAVAELELHDTQLGTVVWCAELIDRATAQLTLPWLRLAPRLEGLRAGACCPICTELASSTRDHLEASTTERLRVARTNSRPGFGRLLSDGRPAWEPRSCPDCLGGSGLRCRRHLLERHSAVETEETARQLARLGMLLDQLLRSMSWQAGAPSAAARWSWVEALGWLGGWTFPVAACRRQQEAETHRSPTRTCSESGAGPTRTSPAEKRTSKPRRSAVDAGRATGCSTFSAPRPSAPEDEEGR